MSPEEIDEIVHDSLANANANGYLGDLSFDPQEEAEDMLRYEVQAEHLTLEEVTASIKRWLEKNKAPSSNG